MQYELTTPCTAADLAPLKAGDTVLLSGVVYTARDQAHKRMLEALDKGEKLPFDLEGSAIYYVGPTPERPGEVIGSAGPTTSGRMDAMSPRLLDLGNKIMIGKGKRDAAVKEAVVRDEIARGKFGLNRQTYCEWLATRYGMWYSITNRTGTPVCPGQGIYKAGGR